MIYRVFALLMIIALALAGNEKLWLKQQRAVASRQHEITIAVKLKKGALDTCDSALMDVSHPDSPNYGKHWKFEQIKRLSNVDNYIALTQFLQRNGVAKSDIHPFPNFDFVRVNSTVETIERVFNTQLYHFEAADKSGKQITRAATNVVLPPSIDFVTNLNRFPQPRRSQLILQRANANKRQSDGNVSPSLLNSYYNIDSNKVDANNSSQSLFESLDQSFAPDDLTAFQQQFSLPSVAVTKVIGPNDPSQCQDDPNNCGEANLDVQWITAIANAKNTWYWSILGTEDDIFLAWVLAVANQSQVPYVHSISYGSIATEDPLTDMERFNTEVCKAGLRGLSVFVASGDDGVANFDARNDQTQCGFTPSYPATSPYVTSVGATMGPETGAKEVACQSNAGGEITTGGGFSIYFSRPSYQDTAVKNYLKNAPNLPPSAQYNPAGRGYPDIALLGHNYPIFIGGQEYVGSGTSASTPVAAAMATLINGVRLAANKSPLGFLNPSLYKLAGSNVFNDITVGENNCCAGDPSDGIVCCQYGFNATTGWDPLTGLGSVNFANLAKALVSQ